MRVPNPAAALAILTMAIHLYLHGGYSWRLARIVSRRIVNNRGGVTG